MQIACLARDVANKQDEEARRQLAALIEGGALVSVQGWTLMVRGIGHSDSVVAKSRLRLRFRPRLVLSNAFFRLDIRYAVHS